MSKIRTTGISPVRSNRSLSKFFGKNEPETMDHTCSECLGRGETILRPATKITNDIDGSLGKTLLRRKESIYRQKNVLKFKQKII